MLAIFFPGAIGPNPQHFAAAEIGDLISDEAAAMFDLHQGPSGGPGQLAYWGRAIPPAEREAFEWQAERRRPGDGPQNDLPRYYVGKLKGEKIAPESLARKQRHPGRDVLLADGQAWHVPAARQLPQILGLDENGHWTGVIDRQYADFWERSWAAADWFFPADGGKPRIDYDAGADFCSRALAINYRVNAQILSFLGLLRSDLIFPIAKAVTELDVLLAAREQKKTEEAPPTLAAGAGAPG